MTSDQDVLQFKGNMQRYFVHVEFYDGCGSRINRYSHIYSQDANQAQQTAKLELGEQCAVIQINAQVHNDTTESKHLRL